MSRALRLTEDELAAHQRRAASSVPTPTIPRPRRRVTPESDVLKAVLVLLKCHPAVAFAYRSQSGLLRSLDAEARMVRVGFRGLSDIVGALRDGRWLAIECKSARGVVSDDQAAFLEAVNAIGGVGIVARSVGDVMRALGGTA